MTLKNDEKFKEKLACSFKHDKEFGEFSPSHRWALFVQSIKVWDKKYSEQRCKIWVNLDLVGSKLAWEIGWTFIKALENLKVCTFMGSFCPKRNWRKNWLVAWKMTRNLVNFNVSSWLKIWTWLVPFVESI